MGGRQIYLAGTIRDIHILQNGDGFATSFPYSWSTVTRDDVSGGTFVCCLLIQNVALLARDNSIILYEGEMGDPIRYGVLFPKSHDDPRFTSIMERFQDRQQSWSIV